MDTTSSVGIIYFLLIFVVSIFFHVMLLAIPVVMYFFRAYSLYRIAKRNHHPHPAIAWFPLANEFLFADLVGKNVKMGSIRISQFPTVRVAAPSVFVWLYIVLYFCVIFLNSAPLALFLFLFYVLWKIAYLFSIFIPEIYFSKNISLTAQPYTHFFPQYFHSRLKSSFLPCETQKTPTSLTKLQYILIGHPASAHVCAFSNP